MIAEIEEVIGGSCRRLVEHPSFGRWKDEENPQSGDIILINNSFVFRDVKTTKAEEYLCLLQEDAKTQPTVGIAVGMRLNNDFKRVAAASKNPPQLAPLRSAIGPQIERLGHLVFLLIGAVADNEVVETKLHNEAFGRVVWDPSITQEAIIEANSIVVRQTGDEERAWAAIETCAGEALAPSLREVFGVALDKLQEQAVARVMIPAPGDELAFGITDSILVVIKEQRDEYARAVAEYAAGGGAADTAVNNVLRIAYNFASDATGFLRLIVSVCDLKPIVLWGTIAEHHALSAAFHALPWRRSKSKASLEGYEQTISDARNSAFHNLFPFRKSLRITLPDTALGAPELQIFSEYTKKRENQLTYQDKALVEVLLDFTRARERSLPTSFWQKNLDVMDATVALFEQTNEFLKLLAKARTA
jgi:hypothetical protein